MTKYEKLELWIIEALDSLGGEGAVAEIAKVMWERHEADLRASGDLFYTWQYAMRWAGQRLQKAGKLKKGSRSWSLT